MSDDPWAIANWKVSIGLVFLVGITLGRQILFLEVERWGPIAFALVMLVWLIALLLIQQLQLLLFLSLPFQQKLPHLIQVVFKMFIYLSLIH